MTGVEEPSIKWEGDTFDKKEEESLLIPLAVIHAAAYQKIRLGGGISSLIYQVWVAFFVRDFAAHINVISDKS